MYDTCNDVRYLPICTLDYMYIIKYLKIRYLTFGTLSFSIIEHLLKVARLSSLGLRRQVCQNSPLRRYIDGIDAWTWHPNYWRATYMLANRGSLHPNPQSSMLTTYLTLLTPGLVKHESRLQ
jgi:hypothetical protein